MRKNSLIVVLLSFCVIFSLLSCSSNSKNNGTVTMEVSNDEGDESIKEFLKTLYDSYVLGIEDFRNFEEIKDNFSPSIVNRLRNEFEYDDGHGYAVWLFRTAKQDGPGESMVYNVNYEGDDWYVVEFSDMGYDSRCRFKVVRDSNKIYVQEYENPGYE